MAGIYKTANGKFRVRFYDNIGEQRSRTFPTMSLAKAFKIETERAVFRGEYRELQQISFSQFADKWLADYAYPSVKISTYQSYRQIIRSHLKPFFEDTKLTAITPHMIQSYISKKVREGRLSPKTIHNGLVPLKEMFKHAITWGYLRENPASHVSKPRVQHKEMDHLTPTELRILLEEVKRSDSGFYPLLLTASLTGMRKGELLGLQWGDINWVNSNIHVRRSYYRNHLLSPKSKHSVRAIPVPKILKNVLLKHRVSSPPSEYDLVFCTSRGTPLDPDNLVRRHFMPALRRARLKRIRFHDLRHTYASLLISQGENLKFVQATLGHASIQTTVDRYGHLMPDAYNNAAERLQEYLFPQSSQVTNKSQSIQNQKRASAESTNALLNSGSGDRI